MSDLIRNLRDLASMAHSDISVADEAADEIERLNAENARLREERPQIDYVIDSHGVTHRSFTLVYKTRAALAEKEK